VKVVVADVIVDDVAVADVLVADIVVADIVVADVVTDVTDVCDSPATVTVRVSSSNEPTPTD
jgi:hypothetical protein